MDDYPEHQKLEKIQHLSQACYDFMEWLGEQGIWLAEYDKRSDACRVCDHDTPHREQHGAWHRCEEEECGCEDHDRGNPNLLYPTSRRREALLADHFGIDLKVLEQEKRAMLDALRRANEAAT